MAETVPETLKKLRIRAGCSMLEAARAVGLKTASGYQRYEDVVIYKKKYLPVDKAEGLAELLAGKGLPPIDRAEVIALAGPIAWEGKGASPDVIPAFSPEFGPDQVPVYGYAAGTTDDALNLHNGAEIGRVARHPKQASIKKAFAVYVVGESMIPRFRPGQTLYILPGRWPAAGEDVVVELENGDGYVKEYRRRTQKEIICWQYNPDGEWRRPLNQVRAVHSVAGTG